MRTKLSLLLSLALLAPLASGCGDSLCGAGLFEQDGVCTVGWTVTPPECKAGSSYDPATLSCVTDTLVCPSGFTVVVNQVTGEMTCEPDGLTDCAGVFTCEAPSNGRVSLCGQLMNIEDNTPIRIGAGTGALCDPANPTVGGGCAMEVSFYDAVQFATDPDTALPLDAAVIEIDDCGRFRGENIAFPTSAPFLAVGVDDASGNGDTWALSGVAIAVSPNAVLRDTATYALQHTTDAMWTASAGDPFAGQSFVDRGVYVPVFISGGDRVRGVTLTSGGSPAPSRTFYFSDTDPNMLTTVDAALTETGANGAAVVVDSNLVMHSGTGGEPEGCIWPSNLADSIPKVAFIQERVATDISTGEPCK